MLPKATFPTISIVHPGEARVFASSLRGIKLGSVRERHICSIANLGNPFAGDTRNRRSRHQLGRGGGGRNTKNS